MFLGEFQHSLDAKGRVILPAKFREQLADGAVVTRGRGGCLAVYPLDEFEAVAREVRESSKRGAVELNAARAFFGGAVDVVPDKQGRVPIPQNLRDFARLSQQVVVVGVYSRVEIWDREQWLQLDQAGESALTTSDALADFGI
jgi:MraZ protein